MAKVYVSSTLLDLEEERAVVMDWLVTAGHQPVHSYSPDSGTVRDSCLDDVSGCDLYVLILGHRYGFRPERDNPEQLAITHLEFRRAGECALPRIALLRTIGPDLRLFDLLDPNDAARLTAFREEVRLQVRAGQFSNREELLKGLSTGIQRAVDASLIDRVRTHLAHGDYIAAEHLCTQVLSTHPNHFLAHLLIAVSLVRGRTADRLTEDVLLRVEPHLRRAAESADIVTAWAIWGLVRHDAYYLHNVTMGEPGLGAIREHLDRLGRQHLDHELLALVARTRDADRYFRFDHRDASVR